MSKTKTAVLASDVPEHFLFHPDDVYSPMEDAYRTLSLLEDFFIALGSSSSGVKDDVSIKGGTCEELADVISRAATQLDEAMERVRRVPFGVLVNAPDTDEDTRYEWYKVRKERERSAQEGA